MRLYSLALLALAGPSFAQTAVRPADSTLAASAITAGEERFTIRLVAPMRQDIGTLTETTTLAGDRITRVMRLNVTMGNQTQADSVVAVWPGLAPVFSSSVKGSGRGALTQTVTYMDGHAMTRVQTAGGPVADSVVTFADPVFGDGWSTEIVRMLPLAAGYSAAFVQVDADDGAVTTTATVTGSETVATAAGPVEAWTVETVRPDQTRTLVVAKDSRRMLAMRFSPQPGARVEIVPAP